MNTPEYHIIDNYGPGKGYTARALTAQEFISELSSRISRPKKVFLGLGDFLELADINRLLDVVFLDTGGSKLASILDRNNRKISKEGNIPFSFFKLAVYYPDFLLKNVPKFCVSAIGKKARLFPGAEHFIKHIRHLDPVVLSAIPFGIAIEFVKRVGLSDENLQSTEYKTSKDHYGNEVYAGGVKRFISGNIKSIIIEKFMSEHNLSYDDVLYIGRGEAGIQTFSTVNSIAFNPSESVIPESRITVYGSSLESLLVFFNKDRALDDMLLNDRYEEYLPSLVVFSKEKGKDKELIDIELKHLQLQNNIIGQRIEYAGETYRSVKREIEMLFTGSSYNIKEIRDMVRDRIELYKESPGDLVKDIYEIARERYRNYFAV